MLLRSAVLSTALAVASLSAAAAPVTYTIDPTHTDVLFSWNHFGFSNPSAHFGKVQGTLSYDPAEPARATVQVTIPIRTVATHVPKLDVYMKSRDAFDAAAHPVATFRSTQVEPGATADRLKVNGNLELHGVTRPVSLDVTLNKIGPHPMQKMPAIGFEASAVLKRSDFGIAQHLPAVGDDIRIRITVEALAGKTPASE